MQACKAEPLYLTATRRIAIAQARALPRGNPAPRVMTRRGRSPGSLLGRGPRLPRLAPSGPFGSRSPLTVAGAASALHRLPRPAAARPRATTTPGAVGVAVHAEYRPAHRP